MTMHLRHGHTGELLGGDSLGFSVEGVRFSSEKAVAMAMAPLMPVPATKQMTLSYREGSAGEKYGPSRRSVTLMRGNRTLITVATEPRRTGLGS